MASRFHLAPSQQDWELIVSDASRLTEFLDYYETADLDEETRFTLMLLIVASLEDYLDFVAPKSKHTETEVRVESLLRRDFLLHLHTVDYWRCAEDEEHPDPEFPNNYFSPAPMMRRIWHDCFRPEYQRWLDE